MAQVGAWGPFGALSTGAKIWGDKVARVTPPPPLLVYSRHLPVIYSYLSRKNSTLSAAKQNLPWTWTGLVTHKIKDWIDPLFCQYETRNLTISRIVKYKSTLKQCILTVDHFLICSRQEDLDQWPYIGSLGPINQ